MDPTRDARADATERLARALEIQALAAWIDRNNIDVSSVMGWRLPDDEVHGPFRRTRRVVERYNALLDEVIA
jgi:hypothetical protein